MSIARTVPQLSVKLRRLSHLLRFLLLLSVTDSSVYAAAMRVLWTAACRVLPNLVEGTLRGIVLNHSRRDFLLVGNVPCMSHPFRKSELY